MWHSIPCESRNINTETGSKRQSTVFYDSFSDDMTIVAIYMQAALSILQRVQYECLLSRLSNVTYTMKTLTIAFSSMMFYLKFTQSRY